MSRITEVARILDATATAFWFELHYDPGKTEVAIVLRGTVKQAAMTVLSQCEVGEGHDRTPTLPIGSVRFLRVVRNYSHFGAIAAASLRVGPEVAARVSASRAAESVLASKIWPESKFPQ